MDIDDQLRNEISVLSSLIASNGSSAGQPLGRPTFRNGATPSIYRPQYRHHPYQRSPSLVNHGILRGCSVPRRGNTVPSIYRYSNPVQHIVSASAGSFSGKGSKTAVVADGRRVLESEHVKIANPFKVVRLPTSKILGDPSNTVTLVPSNLEVSLPSKTIPKSVHINPAHLVSSTCAETLPLNTSTATTTTSTSFKIRPHINPGHAAYHQLCSVPVATTSTGNMKSGSVNGYDHLSVVKNGMLPNQDCLSNKDVGISSLSNDFKHDKPASATVVKSKYKVDRRFKNSYIKTGGLKRGINNSRIKVIKKYSTRLVPQPGSSLPSPSSKTVYRQPLVKYSNLYQKQFGKSWVKPIIGRSLKRGHIIKGRMSRQKLSKFQSSKKAIVHIAGNNYLRKNSGRTLRKIKQRSPAVVNIDGSQFISKNSGKSLKRLFKQSPTSKTKRLSISMSQPQTAGKRLAQRAVFKSKLTLSQRTWKKKRFCVYYNRLGECKKNEEGNCPYIHDRNQLSICPKFVVGKCSIADCKLSHDLNIGRMPPCQFFNKSNCSRENCPYPHIKSTTFKRKSPRRESVKDGEDNPGESTGTPRKRKLSIRKERRSPKNIKKKEDKKLPIEEKDKPKARYYEQSPDSQPVVSIIPRRVRPEATSTSAETDAGNKPTDGSPQIKPSNAVHVESNHYNIEVAEICNASSSNTSCDTKILQRARLLKKVSRLQEKVKPKESNAPQFLPFK